MPVSGFEPTRLPRPPGATGAAPYSVSEHRRRGARPFIPFLLFCGFLLSLTSKILLCPVFDIFIGHLLAPLPDTTAPLE
jgi:hypothetical protein